MAYRLVKPSTREGCLLNFWRKASLRLWAGSVEMMRTDSRTAASCTARAHEVVVLPTPPLPPQKAHFSVFWSSRFWSVGARASSSSAIFAGVPGQELRCYYGCADGIL